MLLPLALLMYGINLILTSGFLALKVYLAMLHRILIGLLQEKPTVLMIALVAYQINPNTESGLTKMSMSRN